MSVRIEIDFAKIERDPLIKNYLALFGAEWLKEAQFLAREKLESRSGVYNRSFHVNPPTGSPPKMVVGNRAPYAAYIEYGTDAHTIGPIVPKPLGRRSFTDPSKPGALRWFTGAGGSGNAVFAKSTKKINIPAIPAKHIVRDAISAAGDKLRKS